MKRKTVRVVLVLAVLAALAAIPASTQVLTSGSQTANAPAGSRLPMLLVVNRLELSRTQMETLRSTIRGLLDQKLILDEKRADFETQMIAFNGTAEELDSLVTAFEAKMAAARSSLREKVVAAVDTLKETLSMKQGEILSDAFPRLFDRLDVLSDRASSAAPQAMLRSAPTIAAGKSGAMAMQRGQAVVTQSDGRVSIATMAPGGASAVARTPAWAGSVTVGKTGRMMMGAGSVDVGTPGPAAAAATKAETLVERIGDRIARRLGMAAANETEAAASAAPTAVTPPSAPMCPMMGTMASPMSGTVSAQVEASSSDIESLESFGTLTISLGDASPAASAAGGEGRLVHWLERLLDVLELKLAAMK